MFLRGNKKHKVTAGKVFWD